MFERFTREARRIVLAAVTEVGEAGADVEPQHLLLALTRASAGEGERPDERVAARILAGHGVTAEALRAAMTGATRRGGLSDDEVAALRSLGIDAEEVFRRVSEAFGPEAFAAAAPARSRRGLGRLGGPFTREAKKVLELSLRESIALQRLAGGRRQIASEHILLALLRAGVPGPAGTVLAERGVTYDDALRRVLDLWRAAA
jgi:hypothetical protein